MNILITGTSSGIGYGLALAYLKQGKKVWGISRREPLDLVAYETYHHLQADLTDAELIRDSLPKFLKDLKQLDLLILNSGILGEIRLMNEVSTHEMKNVMEVNVWANKTLLDSIYQLDIPIRQVVGMSSKASLRSSPGWGSYSLSKAGLNMLMIIYAKEYPNTHFISFAPGLVDSEIQDYIYTIKDTDKYPTTKVMHEARYTEIMPDAIAAAPKLIEGITKTLDYESGSFVDVREM
jgi:NAD(P)-dependent dehydrogenase (short-subunit alcohol dehydrogenase family)